MSSWEGFISNNLQDGGKRNMQAAIIDLNATGGVYGKWAQSPGFAALKVTDEEIKFLVTNIEKADNGPFTQGGFKIGGAKHIFTNRIDQYTIAGRQTSEGNKEKGVIVSKATRCIVVACYDKGCSANDAANAVTKLTAYFISVGY